MEKLVNTNLALRNVSLQLGELRLFHDFSLEFPGKEISCILGPSGCGKTSILRILNSNIIPDKGNVSGTENQKIAFVFQEPRLLPWMTVFRNIEFVLMDLKDAKQRTRIVHEHLERVGLLEFEKYYPGQLSGGMKQRVALARAFAFPAQIILLDEPFKGLDVSLKSSLMEAFKSLWNEEKKTVVFVTHDPEEAFQLGHYIVLLSKPPVQIRKIVQRENLTESLNESRAEFIRLLSV